MDEMYGTFCSQKINKIRWKPGESLTNFFISGSWDDTRNSIKLWEYSNKGKNEDGDVGLNELDEIVVYDDVTQLKFINSDTFVVATSGGDVDVYTIEEKSKFQLYFLKNWKTAHKFPGDNSCACTDFDCLEEDIASVGEDGRINLFDVKSEQPNLVIDDADSCTIRSVAFYERNGIITGNSRGLMKLWDTRSYSFTPIQTFILPGPQIGCTSIVSNPTQKHIIFVGLEDGAICMWDLRNTASPKLLDVYSKSVTEITFHPVRPQQFFSSSSSGQLWRWQIKEDFYTPLSSDTSGQIFRNAASGNGTTVYSVVNDFPFSVNSFDVNDHLIFSCDNEAIYVIQNILP